MVSPLGESAPEPDLFVVRGRLGDHTDRHPTAAEIPLLIEVSRSALAKDRQRAAIFAAAGVRGYLIVDVESRQFVLHTGPAADGYATVAKVDAVPVVIDGEAIGTLTIGHVF